MALLPATGFPATVYPSLPSFSADKIRQFEPRTLPIGIPGDMSYGGRSTIEPTTASHM
jgi:hypothetical protein